MALLCSKIWKTLVEYFSLEGKGKNRDLARCPTRKEMWRQGIILQIISSGHSFVPAYITWYFLLRLPLTFFQIPMPNTDEMRAIRKWWGLLPPPLRTHSGVSGGDTISSFGGTFFEASDLLRREKRNNWQLCLQNAILRVVGHGEGPHVFHFLISSCIFELWFKT